MPLSYCQVPFPRSTLVSIVAYHYSVSVVRFRLASDQQVSGNLLIGGRCEEENTLEYCLGGTAGARLRPFPQYFIVKEAWPVGWMFRLINVSFLDNTALTEHLRLCVALTRSPAVLADVWSLWCWVIVFEYTWRCILFWWTREIIVRLLLDKQMDCC